MDRESATLSIFDRLQAKAKAITMKAARPEDIAKATHEGKMEILGVKLRSYRLDDGRTVIHADDFHKLLEVMGTGSPGQRAEPVEHLK